MRNVVVRLPQRSSAQRAQRWYHNAAPKKRVANAAPSVVVLFPGSPRRWRHSDDAPARPNAVAALAELEQENAELRRHVVNLALEIQELKAGPVKRHRSNSMPFS